MDLVGVYQINIQTQKQLSELRVLQEAQMKTITAEKKYIIFCYGSSRCQMLAGEYNIVPRNSIGNIMRPGLKSKLTQAWGWQQNGIPMQRVTAFTDSSNKMALFVCTHGKKVDDELFRTSQDWALTDLEANDILAYDENLALDSMFTFRNEGWNLIIVIGDDIDDDVVHIIEQTQLRIREIALVILGLLWFVTMFIIAIIKCRESDDNHINGLEGHAIPNVSSYPVLYK